jgi:flagella basal body P-ring formation protein FlgA
MVTRNALILGLVCILVMFLVCTACVTMAAGKPEGDMPLRTRLCESAASFLSQRVSTPGDSVSVVVDLPSLGVRSADIASYTFEILSAKPVAGTVPFKVNLLGKDGTETSLAATARVRIFDTVAVAARRVGRHEILVRGDIRLERREVTPLRDGYFTDPAELAGKRVRRVITSGYLLQTSDVEPVPVVERGSGVTVSVVMGAVTVTSKAKALEDGDLGDLIRVQEITTGKRLIGMVAGERLVILDKSML